MWSEDYTLRVTEQNYSVILVRNYKLFIVGWWVLDVVSINRPIDQLLGVTPPASLILLAFGNIGPSLATAWLCWVGCTLCQGGAVFRWVNVYFLSAHFLQGRDSCLFTCCGAPTLHHFPVTWIKPVPLSLCLLTVVLLSSFAPIMLLYCVSHLLTYLLLQIPGIGLFMEHPASAHPILMLFTSMIFTVHCRLRSVRYRVGSCRTCRIELLVGILLNYLSIG